jgi:hypothetical protein
VKSLVGVVGTAKTGETLLNSRNTVIRRNPQPIKKIQRFAIQHLALFCRKWLES